MNAVDTALANPVDIAYLITGILFIMGLALSQLAEDRACSATG